MPITVGSKTYYTVIDYKETIHSDDQNLTAFDESAMSGEDRIDSYVSFANQNPSLKFSGVKTSQFDGDNSNLRQKLKIKQGVEIKKLDQAFPRTLPSLTVGDDNTSAFKDMYRKEVDHTLNMLSIGNVETLIENRDGYVVFSDREGYEPIGYIGMADKTLSERSRVMYSGEKTKHYRFQSDLGSVDMSQSDVGLLNVLDAIRKDGPTGTKSLYAYANKQGNYLGISAALCGGKDRDFGLSLGDKPLEQKQGTCFIDDFISIQEISRFNIVFDEGAPGGGTGGFSDSRLSKNIHPVGTIPEDEYEDLGMAELDEFDELEDYYNYKVAITPMDADMQSTFNSIKQNKKSSSLIGSKLISMTCGFVYENTTLGNTTLGTDSIAFGGLLHRF